MTIDMRYTLSKTSYGYDGFLDILIQRMVEANPKDDMLRHFFHGEIRDTTKSDLIVEVRSLVERAGLTSSRIIFLSHETFYLYGNDNEVLIFFSINSPKDPNIERDREFDVSIYGKPEWADKLYDLMEETYTKREYASVSWFFSTKSGFDSVLMEIDPPKTTLHHVLYPWFKDELDEYYRKFFESESNILLLLGPPGTGKTTILRDMMYKNNYNFFLTYEEELFKSDSFFINFLRDDKAHALVIEDADALLLPREDGNNLMSKFLNVADGIAKKKKKKIIFSSNQEHDYLHKIDQALTRPGRCYDILRFRDLTLNEAREAAHYIGINEPTEDRTYTLAELFNERSNPKKAKFGFVA